MVIGDDVFIRARQWEVPRAGIHQGLVIGNDQRGVRPLDLQCLALQVERGEAVVVDIARHQGRGLHRLRVRIYGQKEALAVGTAVLPADGIEDLLRIGYVRIGPWRGNGDIVVEIIEGGEIDDRQRGVVARDHHRVLRQVEYGDPIGSAPALPVVAQRKVVRGPRTGELADNELKAGHPRAARCKALQAHPDRAAHALIGGQNGGVDEVAVAGVGIRLVLVIGYRLKIGRVLRTVDRSVLRGKVKDRVAVVIVVALGNGVLEGSRVRTVGQRDHLKVKLHDGVTGQHFRRHVVGHPRKDGVVVGAAGVLVDAPEYLGKGRARNGKLQGLIINYGHVILEIPDLLGPLVEVEDHDPVVIVVTEHKGLRGRIRRRVGIHRQCHRNSVRTFRIRSHGRHYGLYLADVRIVPRIRDGVPQGIGPCYRHPGDAPRNLELQNGKVKDGKSIGHPIIALVQGERARIPGYRIHDQHQFHDVIAALAPVRVRRGRAIGVPHHQDINRLGVAGIGIGHGIGNGQGIVRGSQGKLARGLRIRQVLVIIDVVGGGVQTAQDIGLRFGQIELPDAVAVQVALP